MFESFIGVNFWTALFVLLNFLLLFFGFGGKQCVFGEKGKKKRKICATFF